MLYLENNTVVCSCSLKKNSGFRRKYLFEVLSFYGNTYYWFKLHIFIKKRIYYVVSVPPYVFLYSFPHILKKKKGFSLIQEFSLVFHHLQYVHSLQLFAGMILVYKRNDSMYILYMWSYFSVPSNRLYLLRSLSTRRSSFVSLRARPSFSQSVWIFQLTKST